MLLCGFIKLLVLQGQFTQITTTKQKNLLTYLKCYLKMLTVRSSKLSSKTGTLLLEIAVEFCNGHFLIL